jgi:phage shock protein A
MQSSSSNAFGGNEQTQNQTSTSKMERFAKLSEKISQISKGGSDGNNPQKFERIEQKITDVEDTFNSNLD